MHMVFITILNLVLILIISFPSTVIMRRS